VGTINIGVERENSALRVVVADDGVGLSQDGEGGGGPGSGLGTQIVRTLVTNELGGTIEWSTREGGGTQVELQLVLRVADSARS